MTKKMGRRTFMKDASTAFLGLATVPLLSRGAGGAPGTSIEYRTLGRTGLKVAAVGMGVMNCSDPAVLLRALDLGVNFYDTARRYMGGKNEELVGKVFQGKRDKVLIQTKVRMTSSEKENRESVEASLRSLRTDYVDVLLTHSLKKPAQVCDPSLLEFMDAMKKEGKARFTGFSSHANMAALLREAAKTACHDVALVSYNFTHSDDLKEAVAAAAEAGVGVVAMKTQAGGYTEADMPGLNPHQAALKYALTNGGIATAVPGVSTIEQIEECFAVMRTGFSRADADDLRRYDSYLQGRICTMCGGCSGECPFGVHHTDVMRVAMYFDGYKSPALIEEARAETDLLEKCDRCSECSSCSIVCGRGLDIKGQMERVRRICV